LVIYSFIHFIRRISPTKPTKGFASIFSPFLALGC